MGTRRKRGVDTLECAVVKVRNAARDAAEEITRILGGSGPRRG